PGYFRPVAVPDINGDVSSVQLAASAMVIDTVYVPSWTDPVHRCCSGVSIHLSSLTRFVRHPANAGATLSPEFSDLHPGSDAIRNTAPHARRLWTIPFPAYQSGSGNKATRPAFHRVHYVVLDPRLHSAQHRYRARQATSGESGSRQIPREWHARIQCRR